MSIRETALLAGMVVAMIPVGAAYLRHRSGLAFSLTGLAGLCVVGFLAVTWKLVRMGADPGVRGWVYLLVGMGAPVMISTYLFSLVMGRESASASIRNSVRTFIGLTALGIVSIFLLRQEQFVSGYRWNAGSGSVLLGPMGKAYLSYLLVGAVFVGYNMESTYRLAGGEARVRLRAGILGLFGVLGFYTYVLTTGLLYSAIEIDNLVAAVVPLTVAAILVSYSFLRGTLADTSVPVSRSVVYSSFTAFAAALYVLAMGLAAQLASLTRWTPGQVVTVSFIFLVILFAAAFLLSNRFQRSLRRFIDRNFYVNRYDYRAQWFRVTRTLEPGHGSDGVLVEAEALFREVFLADQVTLSMRERGGSVLRPRIGRGKDDRDALLLDSSPLCRKLEEERRPLLLDRQRDDLEYIPIYVENQEWLEHTASQVIAPLFVGRELLGLVGLERSHPDDRFSYEDLDLLDCMAAQVAAVYRSMELARDLSEAREMQLLSQWSSMILHDLKNYLSPLRLIVQNMRIHMGNPEFQREAVEDLAAVTERMERMVKRLSELRQGPRITEGAVDMNEVVVRALAALQLSRRQSLTVERDLVAAEFVAGDASLLTRVVENLVGNAVDAMDGRGTLTVRTQVVRVAGNGGRTVVLTVEDTGPGMDEAFQREKLFRPFATTKKKGLGLGLYQVRSIVEAHGGEIQVRSIPGEGTVFRVILQCARRAAVPRPTPPPVPTGQGRKS